MNFADSLKFLRKANGYKSAKSFYEFISSKRELSFNYSYFTRMESGSAFPSHKVVQEIASFLSDDSAKNLVMSYCSELFPEQKFIFEQQQVSIDESLINKKESKPALASTPVKQNMLTLRQVATIGKSFEHYVIFLIITLSRKVISKEELKNYLKRDISQAINELKEVKVIDLDEGKLKSISKEQRFPPADFDSSIPLIYGKLDQWDREIESRLHFKKNKKKFFVKRTSKRHLDLILGLLDNIDGVIRISDEMDEGSFNEVFTFEYKLSSGKFPG
jgi:hypothetical protein